MRLAKALLLVPMALLMLAGVSYAAFDNSHHDLRAYSGGATKEGCFQCHGRVSANVFAAQPNNFGSVGGICIQRCHSGAGILATSATLVPVTAPSVNVATYATTTSQDYTAVYFANSHLRTPANLLNGIGGAAVSWPPAGANTWPYMAAGTLLECTSCHAVHDNQNAPFIWAPLGPSAAGAFDGFCDRCHSESARSGGSLTGAGAAPNGNHPINFVVDNVAAAGRNTNGRLGRRIVIQDYTGVSVFDVASPAGSALINLPSAGTAWNMGGKLVTGGTSAVQRGNAIVNWVPTGGTAQLGCFTCHSAHRTVVNGENALVNVRTFIDNGATGWNPMCVGCHGAATTVAADQNDWQVGGLTQWGHPVGVSSVRNANGLYTTSIGGFTFAIATPAYVGGQNGNQLASNGALMCTSCHQVHSGAAGSMALADIGQGANAICKRCHTGVGIPNVNDASKGGNLGDATTNRANLPNMHHVTATTVTNGMAKNGNATITLNVNVTPSWRNVQGAGLGDLATGMDCADCHTFNGTAHNW